MESLAHLALPLDRSRLVYDVLVRVAGTCEGEQRRELAAAADDLWHGITHMASGESPPVVHRSSRLDDLEFLWLLNGGALYHAWRRDYELHGERATFALMAPEQVGLPPDARLELEVRRKPDRNAGQ